MKKKASTFGRKLTAGAAHAHFVATDIMPPIGRFADIDSRQSCTATFTPVSAVGVQIKDIEQALSPRNVFSMAQLSEDRPRTPCVKTTR